MEGVKEVGDMSASFRRARVVKVINNLLLQAKRHRERSEHYKTVKEANAPVLIVHHEASAFAYEDSARDLMLEFDIGEEELG